MIGTKQEETEMELVLKNLVETTLLKFRKPVRDEKQQLSDDIKDVKLRLEAARSRFEFASDDADIESSIYEMESLSVQYRHLLRRARECSLTCDPLDNW